MAYADESDLMIEESAATLGPGFSKDKYIESAALEIDAVLGLRYALPIEVDPDAVSESGFPISMIPEHELNFLKVLNAKLASGRAYLALDAAGGGERFHRYGRSLVAEARDWLQQIRDGMINFTFKPLTETNISESAKSPRIENRDAVSYVDMFEDEFFVAHRNRPGVFGP